MSDINNTWMYTSIPARRHDVMLAEEPVTSTLLHSPIYVFIGYVLFLAFLFVLWSVHLAVIRFLSSAVLHVASFSLCPALSCVVTVRA
jgi:hypothetical protein